MSWGDYNNDGDLDLLLMGFTGTTGAAELWRNINTVPNSPPTVPTGLTAVVNRTGVTLNWNASSDAQTPTNGLTYNLRVGTTPGGLNTVSPQADANGVRRLAQMGNVQNGLSAFLTNLQAGTTYYWSVQAIDGGFAASPFAAEGQFIVGAPAVTTGSAGQITRTSASLSGTVNPQGYDSYAWFEWGKTTNYGSASPAQYVGGGLSAVSASGLVAPLEPNTTYYYTIAASNFANVVRGLAQSFTTTANAAPVISSFTNMSITVNGSTGPIPFTVSDAETAASNLVVTASSSDTTLVPPANLLLSGTGANRSLTVTPSAGMSGATAITVGVSDGYSFAAKSFILNVGVVVSGVPGDLNGDGIVDQSELNSVLGNYWTNSPWIYMTNSTTLGGGMFQFSLTNASAWNFSVLASTNLVNWDVLPGAAVPVYQFLDPQAATNGQPRFYRLRYP